MTDTDNAEKGKSEFSAVNAVREFLKNREEYKKETEANVAKVNAFWSEMKALLKRAKRAKITIFYKDKSILQIDVDGKLWFWSNGGDKEAAKQELSASKDWDIILKLSEQEIDNITT